MQTYISWGVVSNPTKRITDPFSIFDALMLQLDKKTLRGINVETEDYTIWTESLYDNNQRTRKIKPFKTNNNFNFQIKFNIKMIQKIIQKFLGRGGVILVLFFKTEQRLYNKSVINVTSTTNDLNISNQTTQKLPYQKSSTTYYYTKTTCAFNIVNENGTLELNYNVNISDNGGDLNSYGNKLNDHLYLVYYANENNHNTKPISELDPQNSNDIIFNKQLDMNNRRIIGLSTPTDNADGANKKYVDDEITKFNQQI